jgi:EAL domain-containing protein (putative c-di-GMP-specific phosphodiesterase class I)
LSRFPIDTLKIDQSFVHALNLNKEKNDIIVSTVIDMGSHLQHRVVAEGIENQGQLDFLRNNRCAEGQGYFFSRPLAAKQMESMLSASRELIG